MDALHVQNRKAFYEQVPDFWADLYGKEYALFDLFCVEKDLVSQVRVATAAVYRVLTEVTNHFQRLDDPAWNTILQELSYPTQTIPWLRYATLPWPSVIARADWAWTSEGLKLLEWNADTPSFIKELFDVNGRVCRHFHCADPNAGEADRLANVLQQTVHTAKQWLMREDAFVVVSGYPDDEEDVSTNRYLATLLQSRGIDAACVHLRDMTIDSDGVYDQNGKRIDVWFRPGYPLEFLAEERDPFTSESLGEKVSHLVRTKKVALINPYPAFLHQNKMLQAFIWAAKDASWLSETAKKTIHQYFLPSFDVATPFIDAGAPYVAKPLFGREGAGVQIFTGNSSVQDIRSENMLYQSFVHMPKHTVRTEQGLEDAYLLCGCFCIAGQASAVGFRAGGLITDNQSYFLPIGLKG